MPGTQREARGVLLKRRDWVYLLSLLIPFVADTPALKASSVASIPGLAPIFDLMFLLIMPRWFLGWR